MRIKSSRFVALCASLAVSYPLAAYAIGGPVAAQGAAMGTFATGLSILGLWGIVRMTSPAASDGPAAKWGAFAVVLMFFIKLPVFVLLAQVANAMPAPAATYFLGGLALVYSLLVGRVLALNPP